MAKRHYLRASPDPQGKEQYTECEDDKRPGSALFEAGVHRLA